MGFRAAILMGLKGSTSSGRLIDDVGMNATSVHKSAFYLRFFMKRPFQLTKPNKYGAFETVLFGLDSVALLVLHHACAWVNVKNVTGSPFGVCKRRMLGEISLDVD